MAHPELIAMLTHHDKTVEGSKEIFLAAKDAPAKFWGFKDVGLTKEEIIDLVNTMKAAGKTTFLECLAFDEPAGLKAAHLAIECGFDVIMGTVYYDSIGELVEKHGIKYLPFIGNLVNGILYGTIEDTVADAVAVAKKKVTGVDLCGYRYVDGDPAQLIKAVVDAVSKETGKPVCCVGSVDSYEKLDTIKNAGVWAFSIGGAFFEEKFGKTFAEQIAVVEEYLKK